MRARNHRHSRLTVLLRAKCNLLCLVFRLYRLKFLLLRSEPLNRLIDPGLVIKLVRLVVELLDLLVKGLVEVAIKYLLHDDLPLESTQVRDHVPAD